MRKEEYELCKKRIFYYDFTLRDIGIIIEYHGSYYHEDLDYDSTENMNFRYFLDQSPEDFKIDLFKKWIAENRGFDVFVVRSWNLQEDKLKLHKNLKEKGIDICISNFI